MHDSAYYLSICKGCKPKGFIIVGQDYACLISFQFFCISVSVCSGVYFQGTTIGMAPIMSMCTAEQSGGIVMVRDIYVNCETKSVFVNFNFII